MIDLNTASAEELASLPTVGLAAAYDLILYRPYLSWEEVEFAPASIGCGRLNCAPPAPRWARRRRTGR